MKRRPDIPLLAAVLTLTGFGLLVIYSAGGTRYLLRQLLFIPVAVAAMAAGYSIPRRAIRDFAMPIYVGFIVLLGLVLFLGSGVGSNRWFVLGPVAFQPSEFAKLAVVILLARHLAGQTELRFGFRSLAVPVLICFLPAALMLLEPDLSSAGALLAVLAVLLYYQGFRPLHLLLLFTPLLSFATGFLIWTWLPFFLVLVLVVYRKAGFVRALIAGAVSAAFSLLSPASLSLLRGYQRDRVVSFLAPWIDPHGVGWSAIQSRIAIGSGGLFGKGLCQGTQNRLGFLRNRHTDFVFSCIGEEFGFFGSLLVVAAFALVLWRTLSIARRSRDQFSALVCAGCAAIIGYQFLVNVGMLLGLLPITGVALPFISYGGSSLVMNFLLVGLVLNCSAKPE